MSGNAPLPPPVSAGSAILEVHVPERATVYVGGIKTGGDGLTRRYALNGLRAGGTDHVQVRAVVNRVGKPLQQTKTVGIRPGGVASLSFDFAPKTSLTLNVPRRATVHLAGVAIAGTGPVREFSTTKLGEGRELPDYTVRVSVERHGQILSKEQSIVLIAGQTRILTFKFEEAPLAATE